MKLLTVMTTAALTLSAAAAAAAAGAAGAAADPARSPTTRTPIKHLIVVVGENVTFDTLFATYRPPRAGQSVRNLLSERIVNADGSPGPDYAKAVQYVSQDLHGQYTVDPVRIAPYISLPQPTLIGVYNGLTPYPGIPDPRFAAATGFSTTGPFQITGKSPVTGLPYVTYGSATSATGDPVHRFFQMWQQTGGTNRDLSGFAWSAVTTGQGGDTTGISPPGVGLGTGQGAELMGFFNMATGDAPGFRALAAQYAISDNYHQAILGGTGANFFAIATGDLPVYNVNGMIAVPPSNQIENPNPRTGTDNFFDHDGYQGGSYVNCSDATQPGVDAILSKLQVLRRGANCAPGAYYLVNNYSPPFDITGQPVALGASDFVYPSQSVPTIGEALSARGVSWKWYTGGRDAADVLNDPLYPQIVAYLAALYHVPPAAVQSQAFGVTQNALYNSIGDPLNASAAIVNGPLKANLQGLTSFFNDVAAGTLPAVSYVVPKNVDSGHPGYSAPPRYEAFIGTLIAAVQANASLWATTAIVITTDEGGGYFDSGRIQSLDFFGDGPRIPLIVVSPFARAGHVDHTYNDHASVLKFIEHNWNVPKLSSRSRDRLPNPEGDDDLPEDGPAIGDLRTLFTFGDD